MKDKKLFSKIKQKSKDAFMEAYDLYVNDIHRFIYFKVGNTEEANDITSLVFLKAWQYILKEDIDKEKSLKALIYKIARNSVIDHYRQKNKDGISLNTGEDGEYLDVIDEKQDLVREFEISSHFEEIKKALPRIKDEYREVLVMRFINELSFTEIAEVTGKTKGNIRVLSYRALKAIKEVLDNDKR